jgi:putative transposase
MARLPRLTLPDHPHHVILRGNNRQDIFRDTTDHQRLLELLQIQAAELQVEVHAYVLMSNHLHLLVTPHHDKALPLMMQAVGRSYVRQFNQRHGRTGTLWEGRYRSTLLQTERYFLACMVYIDLNPVRAGMVMKAADYPWSSHAHYTGIRQDAWLTPHALYWGLGNTPFARELAYAQLVQAGIEQSHQHALTSATLTGWALGEDSFVAGLQKLTPRRVSKAVAGRPLKQPED